MQQCQPVVASHTRMHVQGNVLNKFGFRTVTSGHIAVRVQTAIQRRCVLGVPGHAPHAADVVNDRFAGVSPRNAPRPLGTPTLALSFATCSGYVLSSPVHAPALTC